jgi:gamma-glutamyltranspeptidase/glutathione hydrolase
MGGLVQPAINLALNGFKITKRLAADMNRNDSDSAKLNPGKNYLLKDGGWKEGDTLMQADLAKTLGTDPR